MSKHTPGPWAVSDESPTLIKRDCRAIGSDGGELIASACCHEDSGYFPSIEEGAANARLIAAAPDLLEALTQIENAAASAWEGQTELHALSIVQMARAARSKVEGKQ